MEVGELKGSDQRDWDLAMGVGGIFFFFLIKNTLFLKFVPLKDLSLEYVTS